MLRRVANRAVGSPAMGSTYTVLRCFTGKSEVIKPGASPVGSSGSSAADSGAEPAEGMVAKYGRKAADAYQSMISTHGPNDAMKSSLEPLRGRATHRGTRDTIERSTVFDEWFVDFPERNGGFRVSKLGCSTCKMPNDPTEGVDALQLQVIKGLNIFEIDGSVPETFEGVMKGMHDCMKAFELEREGIVIVVRGGTIAQKVWMEEQPKWEMQNQAGIRDRFKPSLQRFAASNLPAMTFKTGYDFSQMAPEDFKKLNLIKMNPQKYYWPQCAAITPMWLEACLTNVAAHTALETVDIFLVEGLCVLWEDEAITPEIRHVKLVEIFKFLEEQVAHGVLQYYGISSPNLAPDVPRQFPPIPPDHKLPAKWKTGFKPHTVINLYEIMAAAEKAGGPNHHMRYVSYPFNLTEHQAISQPLPYDNNHTLKSLAKSLELSSLTHCPIQTRDQQGLPVRYHRYPMVPDLKTARLNFFNIFEKAVAKEMEIRPTVEKSKKFEDPVLTATLFLASSYSACQRALMNIHWFEEWLEGIAYPRFRRALGSLREGSPRDVKDWCSAYENIVMDAFRFRLALYQHRHALKTVELDHAIDRCCPKLAYCPIVSQKALNFAFHGGDVCMPGLHSTRYFHEATELNPTKGKDLTAEDIEALCNCKETSFASWNPPHPYMLEAPAMRDQGKFGGQKSPAMQHCKIVDPRKGDWPDIPEELDSTSTTGSDQQAYTGSTSAPVSGPGANPPTTEELDEAYEKSGKFKPHITKYYPRSS